MPGPNGEDTRKQDWHALWSGLTELPAFKLKGHTSVRSMAFSADGTRIVSRNEDNTGKVVDAHTGQEVVGGNRVGKKAASGI